LIGAGICIVFAVLGEAILGLFRVSVPAFQIGGGIIVVLFSLEMVGGEKRGTEEDGPGRSGEQNSEPSLDIATYPLAIPLIASVSGLVAIVSVVAQQNDLPAVLSLVGMILGIMLLDYVRRRSCRLIVKAIGPLALQIIGRIMGVILTGLGVELLLMGLSGAGLIAKPG
jgi:multiple antibiotic resistance protein